jgi:RimJ/RimL family protein N-acetyltransferase
MAGHWRVVTDEALATQCLEAMVPSSWGVVPIVFFDDDGLLGGFAVERYTGPGGSVTLHYMGLRANWLRPGMARLVARYVFEQLECAQVIAEVAVSNERATRIVEKAGFRMVALIPNYFPGGALCVYSLRKEDCRLLRPQEVAHGQAQDAEGAGL